MLAFWTINDENQDDVQQAMQTIRRGVQGAGRGTSENRQTCLRTAEELCVGTDLLYRWKRGTQVESGGTREP